jgi:3,4-dihydroxy 2-butanone 4-phosphate synthase/GTP cyclohydrolase II
MGTFSSIPEALEDIKQGKLIILVDNPNRENEGDFFMPAEIATPENVNFMLHNARGLLCVALDMKQAQQLALYPMVPLHQNTESTKVNFTISVNAKHDISSGVSAFDRAKTIAVLANPQSGPQDITKPGHVFPLIAHPGGLAARQGHTEAAVTLSSLGGYRPAGVVCEILNDNGTMAKLPDLIRLAKKFNLKLVSITDLQRYIKSHSIKTTPQNSVVQTAVAELPTKYGTFTMHVFRSAHDGFEHSALVFGDIHQPMLTRVHSQCLTGDTFGSLLCDCGEQLDTSLKLIAKRGSGILLYLNQEGRGIGLTAKIQAYAKQKAGLDTIQANVALGFAADERDYRVAADMLHYFNISDIELLTNNPDKKSALELYDIRVSKRIALETKPNSYNRKYLSTKKQKLGHQLDLV